MGPAGDAGDKGGEMSRDLEYARRYAQSYRNANRESCKEYNRTWRWSPRGRFHAQKISAKRRGIEFLLTFDQWWTLWQESGHWQDRGTGGAAYCMCRRGDAGPYARGNVYIATNSQNIGDGIKNAARLGNYRGCVKASRLAAGTPSTHQV
jgi:hypothetical protein